jgi:hypothetical protein
MPINNSRSSSSSGRSYSKPSYSMPSKQTPLASVPKPVYHPRPPTQNSYPQQSQPTFGQSIKQGIGAGVGWSIGTGIFNTIFGTNKPQVTETKVVEKVTTCENLRKMLEKSFDYKEREKLEKQIKENCPD